VKLFWRRKKGVSDEIGGERNGTSLYDDRDTLRDPTFCCWGSKKKEERGGFPVYQKEIGDCFLEEKKKNWGTGRGTLVALAW